MEVLVLGGTRFFGRRLVLGLLHRGHHVTVASRGQTADDLGDRVSRLRLDRGDAESMRSTLAGKRYDVVYDQICYQPREAKAALDALGDRVGRYVFTSSMAVYRNTGGLLSESDFDPARQPIDLDATEYPYDEGKRQAEAHLFRHAPFPVVAARVSMVVSGTDDYTGRFRFHVSHIAQEKSIGLTPGEHPITFVTAWDTADFLRFVGTESSYAGPVNVGTTDPMSARELSLRIGQRLGRAPLFHESTGEDPDHSPYSFPMSRRVSSRLAQEIGYAFGPLGPQVPQMVQDTGILVP